MTGVDLESGSDPHQESGEAAHSPNISRADLDLHNIDKRFGEVHAVADVSLNIPAGEFFTLLGPSGCGKTTLLRIIAGLEVADRGEVVLGGDKITSLPANRRQVNTVFQSYALFPHLSIFENVAFGLRSRKTPQAEVRSRVDRRLEMLGLQTMANRYPHELSGGQQQRVALARALVNEPQVLLLDEPMSALDAKLRAQIQVELRRLQRKLGMTFILVTHDQDEALVVSDRIAVMRRGTIVQSGSPKDVYETPHTRFVAEFLGAANLIAGGYQDGCLETELGRFRLAQPVSWQEGTVAIRPERIRLSSKPAGENSFKAQIQEVIYRGTNVDLSLEPGQLRVRTGAEETFEPGKSIWLELPPEALVVLND